MSGRLSAVVTLATGRAITKLDYTFSSFGKTPGIELHAFILDHRLPPRTVPGISYHLLPPAGEYSDPLREIYYRRMAVLDEIGAAYVLTVDCIDVLCVQPLPPFPDLLAGAHVGGCTEHAGSRYLLGQGYTANFLNGGVMLWDVANSRDIRQEITRRGRMHFRTVADDQYNLNEVIQTKHYERLRILPCQYNFRAYIGKRRRGWPRVKNLDGVVIYHNAACMDRARQMCSQRHAELPALPDDGGPISKARQFWRKVHLRLQPHIVK